MDNSNFRHLDPQHQEKIILILKEIILAVTGSFDLDTLLQRIVESCVDFSSSSRGSLFLYDEESEELVMRAEHNNPPKLRFNARYATNISNEEKIGLTAFTFIENKTVVLNSADEITSHPAYLGKYVAKKYKHQETDCHSVLYIPLKISNRNPIGVLKIENTLEQKVTQKFSEKDVQDFELLADIVSKAIINFQNQTKKIDNSINLILSNSLKSSQPGNLNERLRQIATTFKEISNAVGVSIWLKEGSRLMCKGAVGKNYKDLEGKYYDLSIDINKVKKIGLTPWIAKSGETLNIKSHNELVSHPHYQGTFDNILYPDGQTKCESFIGAPLKTGNKIIGIIKADSRIADEKHPENYFTTEEAQIFSYLSIITSIIVEKEQEFERTNSHDRQLIALYQLGTECYELDELEDIFWYLLVGLTHGEGIGYNRANLFKFIDEKKEPSLIGLLGLGPRNQNEGKLIHRHFDSGNTPTLGDSKSIFIKSNPSRFKKNHPSKKLQNFIEKQKIILSQQCDLYVFVNNAFQQKRSQVQLISIDKCCDNVKRLLENLQTINNNFLAFSLLDADDQMFIGICDNVYSQHSPNDQYSINAANTFIYQVSLALSRLSLKKSKEETTEEAWQEFTAITAHRIGTETSIMSGALHFLKNSLSNHNYSQPWKDDLVILENSLDNLRKAVREYTELQKPPRIQEHQKIKISEILDKVNQDFQRIQSNQTQQVQINNNYGSNLPIIYGDLDSLVYAFKEIYENAIKAMPDGGKLDICTSIINEGKYLQIKISDTGTGIKPENLPKIFNQGFKDRDGGTGLGLYIVKRNIELHNGKIEAQNNKTRGATFIVTLPIAKSNINRIMIVDDNDIHLEFLIRSIRGKYSEITIDTARNQNEAIELLNNTVNNNDETPYDFIIADINLEERGGSKFGGIDLLEYVEDNSIAAKVIVITAHTGMMYKYPSGRKKGVLDRAKELGAFACISRNQEKNYLDELNEIINI